MSLLYDSKFYDIVFTKINTGASGRLIELVEWDTHDFCPSDILEHNSQCCTVSEVFFSLRGRAYMKICLQMVVGHQLEYPRGYCSQRRSRAAERSLKIFHTGEVEGTGVGVGWRRRKGDACWDERGLIIYSGTRVRVTAGYSDGVLIHGAWTHPMLSTIPVRSPGAAPFGSHVNRVNVDQPIHQIMTVIGTLPPSATSHLTSNKSMT